MATLRPRPRLGFADSSFFFVKAAPATLLLPQPQPQPQPLPLPQPLHCHCHFHFHCHCHCHSHSRSHGPIHGHREIGIPCFLILLQLLLLRHHLRSGGRVDFAG